jgi:hypothetical protein
LDLQPHSQPGCWAAAVSQAIIMIGPESPAKRREPGGEGEEAGRHGDGGMEDWRGRGPAARASSLEKTLLRAPAGRTRTTERVEVEILQCRKMEPAGPRCMAKTHQAPSGFFLPPMQSLRICHLPSATGPHGFTQLHTSHLVHHGRHETATLQLSPCLAHAQFARRAGDIEIGIGRRRWPMRCVASSDRAWLCVG